MKRLSIFVVGIVIGAAIVAYGFVPNDHHDQHPIADPHDTKYHVHADFHIVINGERLDLSGDEFQTTSLQQLHGDLHLHDNNGDVKHIHAEDKTFVEFLNSLGMDLTAKCVVTPEEVKYCADDTNILRLYVNNERYTDEVAEYVPVDGDRILVYYGVDDKETIQAFINEVPADSCYYSGTCPERGIAPPESCGLTCEL